MNSSFSTNAAAVATQHPLAADAAAQMLRVGGNAVDAAVASMLSLCVVLPGMVGLGGYGGTMVFYSPHSTKTRKSIAIDFDSRCPIGYRDDLFSADTAAKTNFGYLAVTVPAIVSGLGYALEQFGTKTWRQVCQRAIELAEDGFPVDAETRRQLEKWQAGADPVSRRAFFPGGKLPEVGETWIQSDLGKMIRRLANEGPQAFYQGEIPQRIVKQVRDHGGILSEDDFSTYQPRTVDPLSIDYRGYEVVTPAPPAGGVTMLQLLKALEQFDLSAMRKWSAPYLHLVAEASKLCWADRNECLGDPDFVDMPLEALLSDASALVKASKLRESYARATFNIGDAGTHTSNVSVIDKEGTIVSLTATQGFQFGSRVVIDGLGLVMGHGMSRFDFQPNHPNRPQPGKRMHHNMSPTIVLKDGRPFAAVGLPGGTKIITVTAQLLVNLIDFKCSAKETVHAPRVHTDGGEPLAVSGSLPQPTVDELTKMGHEIVRGQSIGGPANEVAGPANAVVIDDAGNVQAASSAATDAALVL